ncbi:uncharacterized protein LOC127510034 [Ctenopharyngodon idella]|uniref:uncharacterized protein LOC127508202 n=1 Tax=Ctenopharyngodon idella TaxID=7959 RepID=UPI00223209EB|nr:uncharacterized protein LOC127508202 [Ctenopharyngodon idella]XP_051745482.1 uncharacterized protein LOC127510034 [Ctenopharyngodon idella]
MAEGPSSPTEMSEISSSPDDPVIRVLLIGRKSSGKSSSGNTILGETRFKEHVSEVCDGKTQIGEKQVCVTISPDLNKEKLEMLKEQLVSGCSAGLSSVLLTVPLEEPVGNEEEILYYIKDVFGPEVQKYIMILFTHGDELEDLEQTTDEHLKQKDRADLQRLLTECGGRFYCFNIQSKSDGQIQGLLQKIEGIMMENGGKFIMKRMKRSNSKVNIVNFSEESPAEDPDSSGS